MKDYWVCNRSQVAAKTSQYNATHVLSLLDPGKRPFLHPQRKVDWKLFVFEDLDLPDHPLAPTAEHVRQILEWGRNLPEDAVVLIHCEAGMCRSTAAALILDVQRNGVDKFDECWKRLLEKRDIALPNPLITLYGDQQLGMGGKMFEFSEAYCNAKLIKLYGDDVHERVSNG